MFDGGSFREFAPKIETAAPADSLNFSAHKRMYQDADLETLQGVLREIVFSLEEISDKNSRRWQEQKKLQALAEEVIKRKEEKAQGVFEIQHQNKTKAELKKLQEKLNVQLSGLLAKYQKSGLPDEKRDQVATAYGLKRREIMAIRVLLRKSETTSALMDAQREVAKELKPLEKNLGASQVAPATRVEAEVPPVKDRQEPIAPNEDFGKKLAAKLTKIRQKFTPFQFGYKSTIALPETGVSSMAAPSMAERKNSSLRSEIPAKTPVDLPAKKTVVVEVQEVPPKNIVSADAPVLPIVEIPTESSSVSAFVAESPAAQLVLETEADSPPAEPPIDSGKQENLPAKSAETGDKLGIGALVREIEELKKTDPKNSRLGELLEKENEYFERFVFLCKEDVDKRIGLKKTDEALKKERKGLISIEGRIIGQPGKEFKLFEIDAAITAITQILDERDGQRRQKREAAAATAVESTAPQTAEPVSEPSTAVSEKPTEPEPAQEPIVTPAPETPAVVEAPRSQEDEWADFEQKVAAAKKKYTKKSSEALDKELRRLKKQVTRLSPQSDEEALLLNQAAQEAIGRLNEEREQAALAEKPVVEVPVENQSSVVDEKPEVAQIPEADAEGEAALGEAGKIARQFFEEGLAQATNEEGRRRFEAYLEKVQQGDVVSPIEFLGSDGTNKIESSIFELLTFLADPKNFKDLKKQLNKQPEALARARRQKEQAQNFLIVLEAQTLIGQNTEVK